VVATHTRTYLAHRAGRPVERMTAVVRVGGVEGLLNRGSRAGAITAGWRAVSSSDDRGSGSGDDVRRGHRLADFGGSGFGGGEVVGIDDFAVSGGEVDDETSVRGELGDDARGVTADPVTRFEPGALGLPGGAGHGPEHPAAGGPSATPGLDLARWRGPPRRLGAPPPATRVVRTVGGVFLPGAQLVLMVLGWVFTGVGVVAFRHALIHRSDAFTRPTR